VRQGTPTEFCYSDTWSTGLTGIVTCVTLSFDKTSLTASYRVSNDSVQQNAFTTCNEPVYDQEVVEIFITNETAAAKPEHYWEIELTPKGTAWVGYDYNPGGDRANLTNKLYPCDSVSTRAEKTSADSWHAEIVLPFATIGRGSPMPPASSGARRSAFKANFFRVQMNPAAWRGRTVTRADMCDPSNCTFTCANCPTTAVPDFHHSGSFGTIVLEEAAQPPDIILHTIDDLGWNDLGFRNADIDSPVLDGLAASGVVLSDYHTFMWSPPARVELAIILIPRAQPAEQEIMSSHLAAGARPRARRS
jgi:hypothetical protein